MPTASPPLGGLPSLTDNKEIARNEWHYEPHPSWSLARERTLAIDHTQHPRLRSPRGQYGYLSSRTGELVSTVSFGSPGMGVRNADLILDNTKTYRCSAEATIERATQPPTPAME